MQVAICIVLALFIVEIGKRAESKYRTYDEGGLAPAVSGCLVFIILITMIGVAVPTQQERFTGHCEALSFMALISACLDLLFFRLPFLARYLRDL